MTANIFGSSFKMVKSDKKYIDSKFTALVRNLETKVDKDGDTITGNLNMSSNKICNVGAAVNRFDAVNKEYVDLDFLTLNNNLGLKMNKAGDTMTGNLNMSTNKILAVCDPILEGDVCNKRYVDDVVRQTIDSVVIHVNATMEKTMSSVDVASKIKDELITSIVKRLNDTFIILNMQNDDITADNLFDIGSTMKDLLKDKDINVEHFLKGFNYIEKMYEKYTIIFTDPDAIIPDIINSCMLYTDLKVTIVNVIENLPKNLFIELKEELIKKDLLSTPDGKSLRKRYRRFLNGLSKIVNPNRSDEALELLIQKNLLLIDLGFVYFKESLLKVMLDDSKS